MPGWLNSFVVQYGGDSVRTRLSRGFLATAAITGVACVAGIGSGVFLSQVGLNIADDRIPMLDASMDIQISADKAHQLVIDHDGSKEPLPAELKRTLDNIAFLIGAYRDGATRGADVYPKVHDSELLSRVTTASNALSDLRSAIERHEGAADRENERQEAWRAARDETDTAIESVQGRLVALADQRAPGAQAVPKLIHELGNLRLDLAKAGESPAAFAEADEHIAPLRAIGVDINRLEKSLGTARAASEALHTPTNSSADEELETTYLAMRAAGVAIEDRLDALVAQDVWQVETGRVVASVLLTLLGLVAIRTGLGIGHSVGNSVLEPLEAAVGLARVIAAGDLTKRLQPHEDPLVELEELSEALNHMSETLSRVVGHITTTAAFLGAASSQVSASSHGIRLATQDVVARVTSAQDVSHEAQDEMDSVREATDAMQAVAREMANATSQMFAQLQTAGMELQTMVENFTAVTGSMETLEHSVTTLAVSQEQMTAALSEVSGGVSRAASVAETASSRADQTAEFVRGLSASAQQIGEIVTLISHIADQTNLLALNATIEAASAGEAGRGFAVVAQEVKALAQQSAEASSRIAERVRAIQNNTAEAVEAISGVALVIADVREITVSMAAAIEEQSASADTIAVVVHEAAAATAEVHAASDAASRTAKTISGNVHESIQNVQSVAAGVEEMAASVSTIADQVRHARDAVESSGENLSGVASASATNRRSAEEADEAAGTLERMAGELSASMTQFIVAA